MIGNNDFAKSTHEKAATLLADLSLPEESRKALSRASIEVNNDPVGKKHKTVSLTLVEGLNRELQKLDKAVSSIDANDVLKDSQEELKILRLALKDEGLSLDEESNDG